MSDFTVSTVPGCRVPHVWLDDGRSVFDAFGPGYTLISADGAPDSASLAAAAAAAGVPLKVVDIGAGAAYDRALVIARPDHHIAWRGDRIPTGPQLSSVICPGSVAREFQTR